ncbi:MAG: helix-turn-helix domain-containing protein [Pseudomonadales bacterium]
MYSIGVVAKKVGIKVPTLRYYEEAGLIPAPDRSLGKQRRYSDVDLERLTFIKHARQLGFSLASIAGLIELGEDATRTCDEIHALAESHLSHVRAKLALLKDLEQELDRIVTSCSSGHIDGCHVIESLAHHEWCESDHEPGASEPLRDKF